MKRIPPTAALGVLVLLSTIVRAWAGLRIPTPWIAADEMIYAEIGRSLWETGHLDILGQSAPFYSLVHPALIGLPLAVFDTATGYDIARVLQALVMSLTAVPVFFWGRRMMSEGWALGAAALTLTIPGLAYTGLLMSETVFVPVTTVAAWAIASALERPTRRNQALLVGAIVLAVLTRLQGLVLVPAFLLALGLYALLERSVEPLRRLAYAIGGLVVLGLVWMLTGGFGAYEPAGRSNYDFGNALKFVVYHAADAVLLAGVVPACAVVMLALRPPPERAARAYLAVTFALAAGLIVEVGLFASRYVGRLAERDLLALAPLLFLGLCLWLARGAPRTRVAATVVALAVAGLVLVLPLGKLVHKAALPDAFSLVPVWELGSYEAIVWGFTGAAVLAFALLPARYLVAVPVVLGLVFAGSSIAVSRYVADEATELKASFFGTADPEWVDASAAGDVSYFYDGEPHWNAVWEHVFWNRKIRRVYWLDGTRRVPGPLPQQRVDPFPLGQLARRRPAERRRLDRVHVSRPADGVDRAVRADPPRARALGGRAASSALDDHGRRPGERRHLQQRLAHEVRMHRWQLRGDVHRERRARHRSVGQRAGAGREDAPAGGDLAALGPRQPDRVDVPAGDRSQRARGLDSARVRALARALLEGTPDVDGREQAGEALAVDDECFARRSVESRERLVERLVLAEHRELAQRHHHVANRERVPVSARQVGNRVERQEPDRASCVDDGIRGVAVGPQHPVHQLADRLIRADARRLPHHQVTDQQAHELRLRGAGTRLARRGREEKPAQHRQPDSVRGIEEERERQSAQDEKRAERAADRRSDARRPREVASQRPQRRTEHAPSVERQGG